jgi:type IV pilus assembly protein PilE
MKRNCERGFTLIELMVAVAIVGILAALAIPSYNDSVRKGKRAEGRAALIDLLQQQERHLGQYGSYGAFVDGTSTVGARFKVFSGGNAANSAYLLQAKECAPPNNSLRICVQLEALPQFNDPEAGILSANSTGVRACTGTNPNACW